MKRIIVTGLVLCLNASCGNSSSKKNASENDPVEIIQYSLAREDLTELLSKFDEADLKVAKMDNWPKEIEVKYFLSRLHPSLPKLLEKESSIGAYKFLAFKKIPNEVRDNILSSTLPEGEHPGYAVFLKSTWQKFFELQDEGYRIGMLSPGPATRISGIYSHARKEIGIDVIASEGTLVHELRHAEQYLSTDESRTGKIEGLSNECYERVSSMFAETDATNKEMPTWFHNMDRLEFEANWYRDRERVLSAETDPVNYPFAQNFDTALDYPGRRAREVQYGSDCPEPVKEFAVSLEEKMDRIPSDLGKAVYTINSSRMLAFSGWKQFLKFCSSDGSPIAGVEGKENFCKLSVGENDGRLQKAKNAQANFDRFLADDIPLREAQLKEVYETAPYFKEFCREMPGFKFYAKCD